MDRFPDSLSSLCVQTAWTGQEQAVQHPADIVEVAGEDRTGDEKVAAASWIKRCPKP